MDQEKLDELKQERVRQEEDAINNEIENKRRCK